jgi:zinc transport system permease protein
VIVAAVFSFVLAYLQQQRRFSSDTVLGILAHSALAVGLVVLSQMKSLRIDLMGYLFGDVLAISLQDIMLIYGYLALMAGAIYLLWQNILLMTIQPDLAKVEGVDTEKTRLFLMLLIATFVALSIKIVGVMLVTSMLIIPAATARLYARTPEQMVIIASLAGALAVVGGLFASLEWDTPSGPSVVVVAALLFAVSSVVTSVRKIA